MNLKVFFKLKKTLITLSTGQMFKKNKKKQKPKKKTKQKPKKNKKTHWAVFFYKTVFFTFFQL
jgi:hypothetical protein